MEPKHYQFLESYLDKLKELHSKALSSPEDKLEQAKAQRELSSIFSLICEEAKRESQLKEITEQIDKIVQFFNP